MTFSDFLATPVQSAFAQADTFLARTAERNAATALDVEAARRVDWRCEETEFLVMCDPEETYRSPRA